MGVGTPQQAREQTVPIPPAPGAVGRPGVRRSTGRRLGPVTGAAGGGPPGATGPLGGRRVVVTRRAAESERLAERLAALGAVVDEVPLIDTAPPADDGRALAGAVERLVDGGFEWLVVSSPAGARHLAEALGGRRPQVKVCAVGPGTASVLEAAGVPVDLVPARHVGEGLVAGFPAATPPTGDGAGAAHGPRRVAVVRAGVGRDVVPEGLAARGWQVEVVEAYRTVPAPVDPGGVAALAAADAATLTSSSTADALADLMARHPALTAPPVVCIGPVTAATASGRGLECLAVADPHSLDGLVDAVVAVLGPSDGASVPGDGAPQTAP